MVEITSPHLLSFLSLSLRMPSTKRKAAAISQAATPEPDSRARAPQRPRQQPPPPAARAFTGMASSPGAKIPDDIWARIAALAMGKQADLACLSLVCREWNSVMHGELAEESLAFVPVVVDVAADGSVQVLEQVARRAGLAHVTLKGAVGDDHLEAVCALGTLRSLELADGEEVEHTVTDAGVQFLASLVKL